MRVTDIEISNYQYDPHRSLHSANVALSAMDGTVNLFCQIGRPAGSGADCARSLVDEAARQLRRMPEFRSGRSELHFEAALAPRMV